MGQDSKIEWCHHTFNPWRGCTKVSAGCANCYAAVNMSVKLHGVRWGPQGNRVVKADSGWDEPLAWDRAARAAGERHHVFCASLADVGEGPDTMPAEAWPVVQAARQRLQGVIRQTPNLDWLLLTKRPENMTELYDRDVLERCWVGTSTEDQKTFDERWPHLKRIDPAVRFLSMEPLLGPIILPPDALWSQGGVQWVIVGGESGPGARPMHPDWARSLRDQCQAAGVAFFLKQWGEWVPYDNRHHPLFDPNDADSVSGKRIIRMRLDGATLCHAGEWRQGDEWLYRAGKKAAGRLLDGREWNEFPAITVPA